jgi:hypothetical protein
MYVCVCVYIYIYIYIYIRIHIHIHTHAHTYMHVFTYILSYIFNMDINKQRRDFFLNHAICFLLVIVLACTPTYASVYIHIHMKEWYESDSSCFLITVSQSVSLLSYRPVLHFVSIFNLGLVIYSTYFQL